MYAIAFMQAGVQHSSSLYLVQIGARPAPKWCDIFHARSANIRNERAENNTDWTEFPQSDAKGHLVDGNRNEFLSNSRRFGPECEECLRDSGRESTDSILTPCPALRITTARNPERSLDLSVHRLRDAYPECLSEAMASRRNRIF